MSQASRDFLKEYAGLAPASMAGAGFSATPFGEAEGKTLDEEQGEAPTVPAEAAPKLRRGEAPGDQVVEAPRPADQQQNRLAALWQRMNQRSEGLPTPGGVGALLLGLLALVSITIPVVYDENGTTSYTRAGLFWLTLIGRTKLASAGAVSGESGSSSSSQNIPGGGPGPSQAVWNAIGQVPGTLPWVIGKATHTGQDASTTTNQGAVARATSSAQSAPQAGALPPASSMPYQLGIPGGNGALPPTSGYA